VLIGSLNLSGSPGTLHVWIDAIFRQHIRWMSEEFPIIHGLSKALARPDSQTRRGDPVQNHPRP